MDQAALRQETKMHLLTDITLQHPRVFHIECNQFPESTYIIESPGALHILLQPWLVGSQLANSARQSTVDFLRVAYHLVPELRSTTFSNITEVVPLAGALYYSTAEAFEIVFGETINRCFIGAKRHPSPIGWVTELSYKNFEAFPENPVVIVGDTIATGGTIEGILEAIVGQASDVQAIIIYSIAGGIPGAVRMKKFADKEEIPLYMFFSNAIFGVESNGTDMPWLHPGTIVSPSVRQQAESVYGSDLGQRWCSIWDWGDRAKHPLRHLDDLLDRCESEISLNPDVATARILNAIIDEATKAVESWKSSPKL